MRDPLPCHSCPCASRTRSPAPRLPLGQVLLVLLALGGCAAAPTDPLAELIERHTEARGGAAALDAIESLRSRVEIVEPAFTVTGDYRATDGQMRIDVRAGATRVFSEGIDAQGAWQQHGAGAPIEATSAAGHAALAHGIEFNLFGLHRLDDRGHRLELAPDERLDGIDYRVVKVRLADGFETWLYVNPANWMIERRRDRRALHPDADPTERLIEDRYLEFGTLCGARFPLASRQVDARTGELLQSTRVLSQQCNLAPGALQIPRTAPVD